VLSWGFVWKNKKKEEAAKQGEGGKRTNKDRTDEKGLGGEGLGRLAIGRGGCWAGKLLYISWGPLWEKASQNEKVTASYSRLAEGVCGGGGSFEMSCLKEKGGR